MSYPNYPLPTFRPRSIVTEGLIGWYKVNEGSGIVVANSSTHVNKLPDLAVVDASTFWGTASGFGYSAIGNTTSYAHVSLSPNVVFDYDSCIGMFFKKINNDWGAGCPIRIYDPVSEWTGWYWKKGLGDSYQWNIGFDPGGTGNGPYIDGWDVWRFLFTYRYYYEGNPYNGLGVVDENGVLTVSGPQGNFNADVSKIYLGFAQFDGDDRQYGSAGASGDIIIYNNKILVLSEWAVWYDKLRSRYGMPARNGW